MRYAIAVVLVAMTVAFAFARGAGPERATAGVLLGMYVLDPIYHLFVPAAAAHYRHIDLGHFAIDLLAMAALLPIGLRANRIWTLWATAAQLLALLAHILRLVDSDWARLAYALMTRVPSYVQMICIWVGTLAEIRRRKNGIRIASWLGSSSRSSKNGARP